MFVWTILEPEKKETSMTLKVHVLKRLNRKKIKENSDLNCNTLVQEFSAETSKPQFLRSKAEITSTQGQNISDLPSYHELQA